MCKLARTPDTARMRAQYQLEDFFFQLQGLFGGFLLSLEIWKGLLLKRATNAGGRPPKQKVGWMHMELSLRLLSAV